jgi:hypothetical protein
VAGATHQRLLSDSACANDEPTRIGSRYLSGGAHDHNVLSDTDKGL